MANLRVSEDIVPIGQFKAQAARWLKHAGDTSQPIVITQNGRPAGVLLSPAEYDRLVERERFLADVRDGLGDLSAGKSIDTAALRKRLGLQRKR
jgi:prevent-host-death family protein